MVCEVMVMSGEGLEMQRGVDKRRKKGNDKPST